MLFIIFITFHHLKNFPQLTHPQPSHTPALSESWYFLTFLSLLSQWKAKNPRKRTWYLTFPIMRKASPTLNLELSFNTVQVSEQKLCLLIWSDLAWSDLRRLCYWGKITLTGATATWHSCWHRDLPNIEMLSSVIIVQKTNIMKN